MNVKEIEAAELRAKAEAGEKITIVDVRTPAEFADRHIPGAVNLPLNELCAAQLESAVGVGAPIFLVCEMGKRSEMGCAKLAAEGVDNLVSVRGGTRAWSDAGFPTNELKK